MQNLAEYMVREMAIQYVEDHGTKVPNVVDMHNYLTDYRTDATPTDALRCQEFIRVCKVVAPLTV